MTAGPGMQLPFAAALPHALLDPDRPALALRAIRPLLDFLRANAAARPDELAVVGHAGRLTHAALFDLALRVAHAVAAATPIGAAIACLVPRSPEGIAALLGTALSGRLCLALDDGETPPRLAALLAQARPEAVLAAEPPGGIAPAIHIALAEALAGPPIAPEIAWDPEAPFIAHTTSGSTGLPKPIVFSARTSLFRALHAAGAWGVGPQDAVLSTAHPASSAGFTSLLAALTGGGRFLMADAAQAGAGGVLRLAAEERATCASIPAPVLRSLIGLAAAHASLRHMRALRIGSTGLTQAELARLRQVLSPACSILHTYSATEAPVIAQWFLPATQDLQGTTVPAGILQPSHEYALMDDAGQPSPPGTPGELVLRSRLIALGEWRGGALDASRVPAAPGRPGWRILRIGDRVAVDDQGLLRVLGRVDRQVKVNAVRVEPAEIEAVILSEPGVIAAAVVAVPGPHGPALHAYAAAPGRAPAAMAQALRQRLAASLPAALRPAGLTVLDRLPTLPGGKPDLAYLAQLATG